MTAVVRDRVFFPPPNANARAAFRELCEHKNPQFMKLRAMGRPTYEEPAVISTWQKDARGFSIPRGLLPLVMAAGYGTVDRRRARKLEGARFSSKFKPYDYQEEAVGKAISKGQGILKLPTAAGKTSIGLMALARTGQHALVLVDSKALADEWMLRAADELEMSDGSPAHRHVGLVGSGKRNVRPLTVAIEQTLAAMKPEEFEAFVAQFGAVLCDEIQGFAAPTFLRTIDRIPAFYRIGVSADHTRPDRKHFLIEDVFGPVIYEKSRKELEAAGFVVNVQVRLFRTEFEADWYRGRDGEKDFTRLLAEIVGNDARTAACVDLIAKRAQTGAMVMGFSDRVDHCYRMRDILSGLGVSAGMLVGEDQGELARTVSAMKEGKLRVGIGTTKAVGKGVNIPAADCGVLCTPLRSRQPFGQVRGRFARRGKKSAELLVAWDWKVFGDQMVKDLRSWNGGCEILRADGAGIISAAEYLRGKKTKSG